ncbi:MAG: hypothetical protein QM706_14125 [Nitrospira sp.]
MPTDSGKPLPADAADKNKSRTMGTTTRERVIHVTVENAKKRSNRLSCSPKFVKAKTTDSVSDTMVLNSSDRLTVLYGHPAVSTMALTALVDHANSGHPSVYLDGAHTFDAFGMEHAARSRRQQLRKALAMIHVARAFSAPQLERLMSRCLADALERYQASTVVISGLLETLTVDGLTANQINRLADRMIESVHHLMQQGFSLVGLCPSVPLPSAPAHRLFAMLRSMSDRCIHVHERQKEIVIEELSGTALSASADSGKSMGAGHPFAFTPSPYAAVRSRSASSVG